MSRARRRYYRTLFLGVTAMGLLAWTAMDQFDLSAQQMREAFLAAALLIGLIAGLGAIAAAVWIGIRTLLSRRRQR